MTKFSKFHLSETAQVKKVVSDTNLNNRIVPINEKTKDREPLLFRRIPLDIRRAKGVTIEDVEGNVYLDFFAGAHGLNIGYSDEEVNALQEQQAIIDATALLDYIPHYLVDKYTVSFEGPKRPDAIKAAVKMARKKTGREAVIAFSNVYHGMPAATTIPPSEVNYRMRLSSQINNLYFAPYSYCFRCPLKKDPQTCKMECFDVLKNMIKDSRSGIPLPAAIIIEPIQDGHIPSRFGYLEKLIKLARQYGIVTIFDEVKSSFFRSGRFLSFMDTGAIPDIILMTIAKELGNNDSPIMGLIYRKDLKTREAENSDNSTLGSQRSLTLAKGTLDFVEKYEVAEHAKRMGKYFFSKLEELKKVSSFIGEIRGRGMMVGIEFIKNRKKKEPDPGFVKIFQQKCLQSGLLFEVGGHYKNVVRLLPPITVTPKIIDNAIEIMKINLEVMEDVIERKRQNKLSIRLKKSA